MFILAQWWLYFALSWTSFQNAPPGLSSWISSQKPQKKCNRLSNLHPNFFSEFNSWIFELSFVLCWHAQSCLCYTQFPLSPLLHNSPSKSSLKCLYNEPLLCETKDLSKTQTTFLFVSPKQNTLSWGYSFDLCPWTLWPSSMIFIDNHHPLSLSLIIPFDFYLEPLSRTFAGDQHPWLLLWPSPMIITNKHCLWPSPVTIIHDDYLWPSPIFILITVPHDHCSQPSPMTFTITFSHDHCLDHYQQPLSMTITHDLHYDLPWPSPWPLAMTAEVSIVHISSIWSLEGIVYSNRIDSKTWDNIILRKKTDTNTSIGRGGQILDVIWEVNRTVHKTTSSLRMLWQLLDAHLKPDAETAPTTDYVALPRRVSAPTRSIRSVVKRDWAQWLLEGQHFGRFASVHHKTQNLFDISPKNN